MIRRYSRAFTVITTSLTLTILAGCGGGDGPTKPVTPPSPPTPPPAPVATSISVNPSSNTLASIGATVQLTATVRDQNNNPMSGQAVTWTSANTGVATVSGTGLVTAVSNGTAQITARSGNASGTASITVAEPVPTRIAITPSSHTLEAVGATVQLSATVRDQRNNIMSGLAITWSSGDDAVATVNADGLVTAVSNGMADITATHGSITGRATITVSEPVPTTVMVEPQMATLEAIGQTVQLTATVLDQRENAMPDETVTWSSGDETVATVDEDGLVTAVGNGMAAVSAQTGDISGSAAITVSQVPAGISIAVEMDATTLTEFGETLQLMVSVSDANEEPIEDPVIAWSTSDETVATVDEAGLVTAVGNGMAEITAQAGDVMDMVVITVMGPSPDRGTLIAIYNATDGMNWTMQGNWLSEERVNMWDGVTTDDRGRVTELTLDGFGLSGMVPMELGQLTNLAALHLQNNGDLEGPLPDSFLDLALMSLNLDGTQVCVPQNDEFDMWLSGIMDAQGVILCEIEYQPWVGLMVEPGVVRFVDAENDINFPISFCLGLNNFPATADLFITVHSSKWQRRDDADSPWKDVAGTEKTFEVCPYDPMEPGEYRLVGDVTFNDDRGFYKSENTFIVE